MVCTTLDILFFFDRWQVDSLMATLNLARFLLADHNIALEQGKTLILWPSTSCKCVPCCGWLPHRQTALLFIGVVQLLRSKLEQLDLRLRRYMDGMWSHMQEGKARQYK